MENTAAAQPMLDPRKELELGFDIIASSEQIFDLVYSGKIDPSEVRETLRELVQEVGVGYTDRELAEMTAARLLHDLAGRF